MKRTRIVFVAVLALALGTPSCVPIPFHHKHRARFVPPPPAPVRPLRQVALTDPPEISAAQPDLTRSGPSVGRQVEVGPPPAPRHPRPRPHEEADTPPPAAPEPPTAVALPQFEQILTPEQRRTYTEEIEKNISNAQRAVVAVQSRRLNHDQETYLARVRTFIEQANEARKADLFRARNLAERANVLADDLLKSVQ